MRHLGSIVLSLVLAAAVYLLIGAGIPRLADSLLDVRDVGNEAIGVLAMLAAGALYLLMVLPRFSPLGPLVAALGYLGVQAYAMVPSLHFVQNLSDTFLGSRRILTTPAVFGLPLVLAVPLLGTVLSPQRWRGRSQPAAAAPFAAAPFAAAPPGFPPYSPPVPGSAYSPPPTSGYPPPPLYPGEPVSGSPAHAAANDDSSETRPLYQPPAPPGYPAAPAYGQPSSGAPSYPPSPPMPSYPPPHSAFAPPGYTPPPSSVPPSSGPPGPPPFPAAPARSYGAPTYGTGEPPPVPSGSVDPEPPPDPDTTRKL